MLACHSLTISKAKYCQDYEEAAASTTNTRCLDDLLKRNCRKTVAPAANCMDLKLNIGSYCGLLWTIFGDLCDYYKDFLKVYRILDRKECFTIWKTYTKEVCARITWVVDNRRTFFGQNPMVSDFAARTTFKFLVSYLEGITGAVCNANPIQQATFPHKWLSQSLADFLYGVPSAGPPPTHWGNPAPAPTPALAPSPSPRLAPSLPKEDPRHQKIKLLMDPYLKCYTNFLKLLEILTSSGKQMTNLPTLPQYCQPTGQPFLCWNSILGKCFRGTRCKYSKGHLKTRLVIPV
jgi:hypothetical protein